MTRYAARKASWRMGVAAAAALATGLATISAQARTNDPGYLEYDGGATLLGPDGAPVAPPIANPPPSVRQLDGVSGVALSFQGVSQYDTASLNSGYSFIPPDTMGAVGATQFMETTNGGYAVYDKTTGARLSMISDAAFWTAAGRTNSVANGVPLANGDARVMYDPRSQKWIVASFAASLSTIQFAVSNTSDALGGWKSFAVPVYSNGIADYPTLALDSKGVYIGANDFTAAGAFAGETLAVMPRAAVFGATPKAGSIKKFFTSAAAINAGADPGFAIQGVNQGGSDYGRVLAVSIQTADLVGYNVTWSGTKPVGVTASHPLGTTAYDANSPGRQPSAINPRVVDTLDDRVSSSVWEQNGKIYAVHTVTPTGTDHTAIVWTVSDAATGTLIQEGTIGDTSYDYYQGAIAVNAAGQAVIVYDRSGSDPTTGALSVFAQSFDPLGGGAGALASTGSFLLHVSPTTDYHNGSVDGQAASGRQRWGDYAQVSVDPTNPESFWVIGEFAREPNNAANGHPGGSGGTRWGTWIADLSLTALSGPQMDAAGLTGPGVAAVPEPAAWAMMLAGFSLAGALLRRRRTPAAAA